MSSSTQPSLDVITINSVIPGNSRLLLNFSYIDKNFSNKYTVDWSKTTHTLYSPLGFRPTFNLNKYDLSSNTGYIVCGNLINNITYNKDTIRINFKDIITNVVYTSNSSNEFTGTPSSNIQLSPTIYKTEYGPNSITVYWSDNYYDFNATGIYLDTITIKNMTTTALISYSIDRRITGRDNDGVITGNKYQITNLIANTRYQIIVNSTGTSTSPNATIEITAINVPDAPTLTASYDGSGASLSWVDGSSNGGSPVTSYDLIVSQWRFDTSTNIFSRIISSTFNYRVGEIRPTRQNLSPFSISAGVFLTLAVRAYNSLGPTYSSSYNADMINNVNTAIRDKFQASYYSDGRSILPPAVPTLISATPSSNVIIVNWTNNRSGCPISFFDVGVFRPNDLSNAISVHPVPNSTDGSGSYYYNGFTTVGGGVYLFRIRSKASGNKISAYSNLVSAIAPLSPPAPTISKYENIVKGLVIYWNDSYYDTNSSSLTYITNDTISYTVNGISTLIDITRNSVDRINDGTISGYKYQINNLIAGATYQIAVRSKNSYGWGGYSPITNRTILDRPDSPIISTNLITDGSGVRVNWSDGASNGGSAITFYRLVFTEWLFDQLANKYTFIKNSSVDLSGNIPIKTYNQPTNTARTNLWTVYIRSYNILGESYPSIIDSDMVADVNAFNQKRLTDKYYSETRFSIIPSIPTLQSASVTPPGITVTFRKIRGAGLTTSYDISVFSSSTDISNAITTQTLNISDIINGTDISGSYTCTKPATAGEYYVRMRSKGPGGTSNYSPALSLLVPGIPPAPTIYKVDYFPSALKIYWSDKYYDTSSSSLTYIYADNISYTNMNTNISFNIDIINRDLSVRDFNGNTKFSGYSTTISNLTAGVRYRFTVKSKNNGNTNWSPLSNFYEATAATNPDSPIITSLLPDSSGVRVNWRDGNSNGGSPITNYNLNLTEWNFSQSSNTYNKLQDFSFNIIATPDKSYYHRTTTAKTNLWTAYVIAYNGLGVNYPSYVDYNMITNINISRPKDPSYYLETRSSIPPAKPTLASATIATGGILLRWTKLRNEGLTTKFIIGVFRPNDLSNAINTYESEENVNDISGTYFYNKFTAGGEYYFKVKSYGPGGTSEFSNSVSAIMPTNPPAPTIDISGCTYISGGFIIKWKDNYYDANSNSPTYITNDRITFKNMTTNISTSYDISRTIINAITQSNSYRISTLTTGVRYQITVKSKNSYDWGLDSTAIERVATVAPSPPIISSFSPFPGILSLNWTDGSSNGGSPITNYKLYFREWIFDASTNRYTAKTNSDTVVDLPGTFKNYPLFTPTATSSLWTVYIRSYNILDQPSFIDSNNNINNADVINSTPFTASYYSENRNFIIPSPPNLTSADVSSNGVSLKWTKNRSGGLTTKFIIDICSATNLNTILNTIDYDITYNTSSSFSYTWPIYIPGTIVFRIKSFGPGGTSGYSNSLSALMATNPDPPIFTDISRNEYNNMTIRWKDNTFTGNYPIKNYTLTFTKWEYSSANILPSMIIDRTYVTVDNSGNNNPIKTFYVDSSMTAWTSFSNLVTIDISSSNGYFNSPLLLPSGNNSYNDVVLASIPAYLNLANTPKFHTDIRKIMLPNPPILNSISADSSGNILVSWDGDKRGGLITDFTVEAFTIQLKRANTVDVSGTHFLDPLTNNGGSTFVDNFCQTTINSFNVPVDPSNNSYNYKCTNLVKNTQYYVRVRANNSFSTIIFDSNPSGAGIYSNILALPVSNVPTAPLFPTVIPLAFSNTTDPNYSRISYGWSTPTNNGGSDISGYLVFNGKRHFYIPTTAKRVTFSTVLRGQLNVQIAAVNKNGTGPYSPPLKFDINWLVNPATIKYF